MPRLPPPRSGEGVRVKDRPLNFSFWPMYRTTRRYGLQAHLYATNPWALIETSIKKRCPSSSKDEALACLLQAEYFYRGASAASEWAAKPLPLYYSFMNLAKAFSLTESVRRSFDQAQHGLGEKLSAGRRELLDAFLEAYPSRGKRANVFADFLRALSGQRLTANARYEMVNLLPQIVAGHRLWCDAAGKRERFIALESVPIMHKPTTRDLWLELRLYRDDLTRLNLSRRTLLTEARLSGQFHEVAGQTDSVSGRYVIHLEQINTRRYTSRPSDEIPDLIRDMRHYLWATVTTIPPSRRYYLYLAPTSEQRQVLPQLLAIYGVVFCLGSIPNRGAGPT